MLGGSIACGLCVDGGLIQYFGFLPFWFIAFLAWSLVVGNVIVARGRIDDPEAKYPVGLFGIYIVLLVLFVLLTGGSLLVPFLVIACIWPLRLMRSRKSKSMLIRRSATVLLLVLLVLIPVGMLKQLYLPHWYYFYP